MQSGYFKELSQNVFKQLRNFKQGQPKVMNAFNQLAQVASADGVLDKKTKEMMALGIAVAIRCDDCIAVHVQSLVRMGMTREELEEVLATAVYMGGGPSLMYSTHALQAFDDFSAAAKE
ncbi:MAG TPA: carboxymuconolactone decarboxylase family protein [Paenalcaligenes sp.]|nr:carboxymuconolactone decarboxylase family protein [Paenalcaligenes sp.]